MCQGANALVVVRKFRIVTCSAGTAAALESECSAWAGKLEAIASWAVRQVQEIVRVWWIVARDSLARGCMGEAQCRSKLGTYAIGDRR